MARGISFRLPFRYWRPIAIQSDYVNQTGNGARCLTVDRIKNNRGYYRANVQFLTRSANSIKKAKQDEIRHRAGYAWKERYK